MTTTYQRDPTTGQLLFDASGYPLVNAAPAKNYGIMQARIADEVLGSPTTAQIQNAIQDAIGLHDEGDYWFNSIRYANVTGSSASFETAPGKEFYSDVDLPILVNYPHISKMQVVVAGTRYRMVPRTSSWVDDMSLLVSQQGIPTDWCWQAGAIRLYLIPSSVYPINFDGTIRFAPLVNDTDTSPWMDDAENMIRYEAKRLLFTHIIRDEAQATVMQGEVDREKTRLKGETMLRQAGSGRMRPSSRYF